MKQDSVHLNCFIIKCLETIFCSFWNRLSYNNAKSEISHFNKSRVLDYNRLNNCTGTVIQVNSPLQYIPNCEVDFLKGFNLMTFFPCIQNAFFSCTLLGIFEYKPQLMFINRSEVRKPKHIFSNFFVIELFVNKSVPEPRYHCTCSSSGTHCS